MMPSAVPPREKSDAKWQGLKSYILRQRQRQKEEQEADAEVQRQRREREQKQKQNVMTLSEIKQQLEQLDVRLCALTDAKHQLFLSLKKVLNEDDNRRKQAVKESSSELLPVGSSYPGMTTPVFLQPMQSRVPLYKIATSPSANSTVVVAAGPSGTKRPRSPSPPTTQSPTQCYLPYNSYKSPTATFQHQQPTKQPQPTTPVQVAATTTVTQPEDGRRNHEYVRAVLWNKGTATAAATYAGVYGGAYGVAPSQPVYTYSGTPAATYEQVYLPRQPYDGKQDGEKLYLRGPSVSLPVPVHAVQATKAGSITTGFPVRASHQQHSVYLPGGSSNSTRLLYGATPTTVPAPAPRYQSSGAL